MEPEWEVARSPDAARIWSEVLRPLAADLDLRARELSVVLATEIARELPELFADADEAEENRASTEASIRAVAAVVAMGADPHGIELPVPTLAYAREGAHRGVPLGALLRSYRLGHAALWRILAGELPARTASGDDLARAVDLLSAWVFAYVDAALSLAERFYAQERERWLRSATAARSETIEAILSGRQRDGAVAARRLRYELDRHHLGLIAWADGGPEGADSMTALESAVAQLAEASGAQGSLVQPLGRLSLAAWLSAVAPFDPAVLDGLRFTLAGAPGVHIAVGEPAQGIAGFAATHQEALHARRVASMSKRPAGTVTRYGRVALNAMATVDPKQARAFVARELGDLAGDDDTTRRIAATVRAYLDEHTNRSRTAKRLGVHENTITYRVRQAEEILGRRIDERSLELRVALALASVVRDGTEPHS